MSADSFAYERFVIHRREGVYWPLAQYADDSYAEQIDISEHSIFIEIPALELRQESVTDPGDPLARAIIIEREIVEQLPEDVPVKFVVINETGVVPRVMFAGILVATGDAGEPDE